MTHDFTITDTARPDNTDRRRQPNREQWQTTVPQASAEQKADRSTLVDIVTEVSHREATLMVQHIDGHIDSATREVLRQLRQYLPQTAEQQKPDTTVQEVELEKLRLKVEVCEGKLKGHKTTTAEKGQLQGEIVQLQRQLVEKQVNISRGDRQLAALKRERDRLASEVNELSRMAREKDDQLLKKLGSKCGFYGTKKGCFSGKSCSGAHSGRGWVSTGRQGKQVNTGKRRKVAQGKKAKKGDMEQQQQQQNAQQQQSGQGERVEVGAQSGQPQQQWNAQQQHSGQGERVEVGAQSGQPQQRQNAQQQQQSKAASGDELGGAAADP
jgi:hypothetical protein